MSTTEGLAQAIAAASPRLTQATRRGNSFRLNCPCHEDAKNSLAIYESGAVKCYGGCAYKTIHDWCTDHGIEWLKSNSSRVDISVDFRRELTRDFH